MSGELGHAGFRSRAPQPGDPVVCPACGVTVGTRGGLESNDAKASAEAAHAPECRARRDHMQQHRTAVPCPVCAALAPAPVDTAGSGDTATDHQGDSP